MISQKYIQQGVKIRKNFLEVNQKMNLLIDNIREVGEQLKKHTTDLERLNENLEDYTDVEAAKKDIFNKLNDVEQESKKLAAIYEPLNKELESLKKQEELLYNNIKNSYPKLSDQEIIEEFKPFI